MPEPTARPVNVFVSYAHKDKEFKEELRITLSWMERQGLIKTWYDHKIVGGQKWNDEIRNALNNADLVLLLVSRYFLASPFILDEELAPAMTAYHAGTKLVIPIFLSEVDDTDADYLAIKGFPSKTEPIENYEIQNQAWRVVSEGIRESLNTFFRVESTEVPDSEVLDEDEGSRAKPKVHSDDPHLPPHNPDFTGRNEYFERIREQLLSQPSTAAAITQSAAIHGLGGVGKTQLATEYAYRYHGDYTHRWFIVCEPVLMIRARFAAIARDLVLPEAAPNVEEEARIEAVKRWLRSNGGWLIVYDNVDRPEDIAPFLTGEGGGHQLVTSRCREWRGTATAIELETFSTEDAVTYLQNQLGEIDDDDANSLADTLGYLPLALAQAAAYMHQTGETISGYLDLFTERRDHLLAQGVIQDDEKTAVSTTWNISLDAAAEYLKNKGYDESLAADLLKLIAFFAPDAIPLETIEAQAKHLPEPLQVAMVDRAVRNDVIAALQMYSLAKREVNDLTVHRLVPAVMLDRMNDEDKKVWGMAALKVLAGGLDLNIQHHETWPIAERHVTHALRCVDETEKAGIAVEEQSDLLNQAGRFKRHHLDFTTALDLYQRAHECALQVHGEESALVATVLSNWGDLLRQLGQLQPAREKIERALEIEEAVHGPDHPNVAVGLNNLAGVLYAQGDLDGARERYERVLVILMAVIHTEEHPYYASTLNNLGEVLRQKGDLGGARERFERALAIDETVFGPDHPNVATDLNNLALVLQDQGDLDGARQRYERAWAIDEAVYGLDHPEVATDLHNLAALLDQLGEQQTALSHFERALAIRQRVYGPDHLDTQSTQSFLNDLRRRMEK